MPSTPNIKKNVPNDFWRLSQLLKLRADQSHPYAKFGTGNAGTLRNGDKSARAALLKFHQRYYQADQMSAVVIGPQPLDELQQLAVNNFQSVPVSSPPLPGASDEYDRLPLPFRPASSPSEAWFVEPIRDVRELKLAWCVPIADVDIFVKAKPDTIWALLVIFMFKVAALPSISCSRCPHCHRSSGMWKKYSRGQQIQRATF